MEKNQRNLISNVLIESVESWTKIHKSYTEACFFLDCNKRRKKGMNGICGWMVTYYYSSYVWYVSYSLELDVFAVTINFHLNLNNRHACITNYDEQWTLCHQKIREKRKKNTNIWWHQRQIVWVEFFPFVFLYSLWLKLFFSPIVNKLWNSKKWINVQINKREREKKTNSGISKPIHLRLNRFLQLLLSYAAIFSVLKGVSTDKIDS